MVQDWERRCPPASRLGCWSRSRLGHLVRDVVDLVSLIEMPGLGKTAVGIAKQHPRIDSDCAYHGTSNESPVTLFKIDAPGIDISPLQAPLVSRAAGEGMLTKAVNSSRH